MHCAAFNAHNTYARCFRKSLCVRQLTVHYLSSIQHILYSFFYVHFLGTALLLTEYSVRVLQSSILQIRIFCTTFPINMSVQHLQCVLCSTFSTTFHVQHFSVQQFLCTKRRCPISREALYANCYAKRITIIPPQAYWTGNAYDIRTGIVGVSSQQHPPAHRWSEQM